MAETLSLLAIKALSGGGSPEAGAKLVGTIDDNSTTFPTERPSDVGGGPLQNEDYVIYVGDADAEHPKTIQGVSFTEAGQQAYYITSLAKWIMDPGVVINTRETVISDPELESIEGRAQSQYGANKEMVRKVGKEALTNELTGKDISQALNYLNTEFRKAGFTFTLTETGTDSNRSFVLQVKDKSENVLLNKTLSNFVLNTRKVAGIDLVDDITAQELEDALKDIAITYTNKSIDADDNIISNLEADNFKASAKQEGTTSNNKFAMKGYVDDEVSKAGHALQVTPQEYNSNESLTFELLDKNRNIISTTTLTNFLLNTRKIAGMQLANDISADSLEDALKAVTVTYTNKSIDADNNTISNLTQQNFKASAIATDNDIDNLFN